MNQHCPICTHAETVSVCHRPSTVVHQNLLYATRTAARNATRGTVDLRSCVRCGFVFNAAFDGSLLEYGPNYENSQEHSLNFMAHIDTQVTRLLRVHGITSGRVIEIGCGTGTFLTRLVSHPDNHCTAIGYDPAYRGPGERLASRLQFAPQFYTPESSVRGDVVICRHVIEHLPNPLPLLTTARQALEGSSQAKVFLETPCAEWILNHRVLWDIFYEHCSLFTPASLTLAMSRAGFRVSSIRHVFGGQYLWAEGTVGTSDEPLPASSGNESLAFAFASDEASRVRDWRSRLEVYSARGPVVVWGAGAKGVTFCNLADPDARLLTAVVDTNPAKQGRFLAGTGHRIVSPEQAAGAAVAVVLNPNYVAEIQQTLNRLGASTKVVDLMNPMSAAA